MSVVVMKDKKLKLKGSTCLAYTRLREGVGPPSSFFFLFSPAFLWTHLRRKCGGMDSLDDSIVAQCVECSYGIFGEWL